MGDWEAEGEKREWHRDEVRESWRGMEGDGGEPYRQGAHEVRSKNEHSQSRSQKLEGGQRGLWGVLRGKGKKEMWLGEKKRKKRPDQNTH